jgi:hypothetical protein
MAPFARWVLFSAAIVIAMAASAPVSAQTIMGAGSVSCAEWVRIRSVENLPQNTQELSSGFQLKAWMDGYLSGFNVGKLSGPDFLLDTRPTGPAMSAFVDNYCRANPLGVIVEAAHALLKELQSRSVR